jgi:hypothetical protein
MTSTALELVLVLAIGDIWALDRMTVRQVQSAS